MSSTAPSIQRYLRHVGTFPASSRLVLLAAFGYGLVEFFVSQQAESGLMILLILSPICVGTGLLSSARQGRLDFLFGSGVSRIAVFRATMIGATSPAFVAALVLAGLDAAGRGSSVPLAVAKVGAVALFTLGVCAAAGVVEPRYVAGVVWLGLRIALLVSRTGLDLLVASRHPEAGVPVSRTARTLAGVAFPEALLWGPQPFLLFVVVALLGIGALFVSMRLFLSAELTGRRAE